VSSIWFYILYYIQHLWQISRFSFS
jgi:hypothetical protein